MENSIEEDIINAQHFINSIKTDKDYKDENGWHGYYNTEIVELARMLDHILSDYKRVLKINEVLLKENEELKKNYINVQDSTNTTFYKVAPPPEPQLPTKTLCESFSKKVRNK